MRLLDLVVVLLMLVALCPAQQGAATGEPLVVSTTVLPKAYARQTYRYQLAAQGGIQPFHWEVTQGEVPPGMEVSPDGMLRGVPARAGDYSFTVSLTDGGKPRQEKTQPLVLHVVTTLLLEWSSPAKVNGQRVEGAVKVSNGTEQDFDLTVIVVAVNEIGRATALGYQHFVLKKGMEGFEIRFGENLPHGAYSLNVDAVGEVEETNSIYRARLVRPDKLQVQQGP